MRLGPSPPPGFRALHVERFIAISVCGPLVINTWTGPTQHGAPQARRMLDEMKRLREGSHAKLLLYVYLIGETASIPDGEARKINAQLFEYFDGCVGIHEGNSLRASLVRGVVTSTMMLSRLRRPRMPQIVSTAGEAARALAPQAGGGLDEAAILAAVEETRRLSLP
jgi:hypothetical protein